MLFLEYFHTPCHNSSMVRFARYEGSTHERPSSEKSQSYVSPEQTGDIEFRRTVKTAALFRHFLQKQTIGADDRRSSAPGSRRVVHNHQVIAYGVEIVLIALGDPGEDIGDGLAMFIKHLVSKFL